MSKAGNKTGRDDTESLVDGKGAEGWIKRVKWTAPKLWNIDKDSSVAESSPEGESGKRKRGFGGPSQGRGKVRALLGVVECQ